MTVVFEWYWRGVIRSISIIIYNPNLSITITVDVSQYGLGAILSKEGQPMEFTSRTMSETQQRYAQIERK